MKRIRLTVESLGAPCLQCVDNDGTRHLVDTTMNAHTQLTSQRLSVGMRINAVSCIIDTEGIVHPQIIIIEPDFLVDITTIARCEQEYGDSAFISLISKLQPNEATRHILLGDFANQFLDDAFNSPDTDYNTSMHRAFSDRVMSICACPDIDAAFFDSTRKQYENIKKTVKEVLETMPVASSDLQLEPSFLCETLGIQGRMDCLIDNGDSKFLIELKSGKWDEYLSRPNAAHTMQMLLYKEVLYYNMDIKQTDVKGNLFYSKYPKLQELKSDPGIVQHAMDLRNAIVLMEFGLAKGESRKWLPSITPDKLRKPGKCSDKFWNIYCLPKLRNITAPLHSMDPLTSEYFHTMLQFIEREHIESKVSEASPNTDRVMSSLWNTDLATKLDNGDIIIDLVMSDKRLTKTGAVDAVCLKAEGGKNNDIMPNIRIGDAVILYQHNSEADTAVTQQIVRGSVESQENEQIWLKLRYPQRNLNDKGLFAIEHDHIEASFNSLYSNLFSIVTADKQRHDLLLCQREPEFDSEQTLSRHYLNEQIDNIVLKAKQAQDMFLLMGPPGTGKTSVALKSMVEEFLASNSNILLLSYTNRAVDEICEMLSTILPADGSWDYIRLGRELSCAEQHRSHLLSNILEKMSKREEVKKLIGCTRVFVSTVASMNSHSPLLAMKHFDVAIFDEASQILEPHILSLLTSPSIGKFIMIGDHKQLPAVVVQSEECSKVDSPLLHEIGLTNCRNSLFERLYEKHSGNGNVIAMLDHQGRMHPDICAFPSAAFYDGKLQAVGVEHQTEELPFANYDKGNDLQALIATSRVAFIDTPLPAPEERQTKANLLEAKTIAQILANIIELHRINGLPMDIDNQIGVIVPFRRQIALVRSEIEQYSKNIVVDTVERYQGSQRDIIIYGTTITQPYELDILSNISHTPSGDVDRKLNVALTRARKQLFILGNRELLSQNKIYAKLVNPSKSEE